MAFFGSMSILIHQITNANQEYYWLNFALNTHASRFSHKIWPSLKQSWYRHRKPSARALPGVAF